MKARTQYTHTTKMYSNGDTTVHMCVGSPMEPGCSAHTRKQLSATMLDPLVSSDAVQPASIAFQPLGAGSQLAPISPRLLRPSMVQRAAQDSNFAAVTQLSQVISEQTTSHPAVGKETVKAAGKAPQGCPKGAAPCLRPSGPKHISQLQHSCTASPSVKVRWRLQACVESLLVAQTGLAPPTGALTMTSRLRGLATRQPRHWQQEDAGDAAHSLPARQPQQHPQSNCGHIPAAKRVRSFPHARRHPVLAHCQERQRRHCMRPGKLTCKPRAWPKQAEDSPCSESAR